MYVLPCCESQIRWTTKQPNFEETAIEKIQYSRETESNNITDGASGNNECPAKSVCVVKRVSILKSPKQSTQ